MPVKNPKVVIQRWRLLPRWVRRMDAAAARRINNRVVHPTVDRAYLGISRAADSGRLWFAIAAVLLLFGRERAATRGVASLTVGSILANLVGKKIFGGDRPLLKDIPIGRRLRKSPTSGSFPSGHSASAGAFAVGVALEAPKTGAAIAPLAAAVAYSRLHTGAHWLSDVIGGATLGAAIAALGKVLVPARRKPMAPADATETEIPLRASHDGAGLLILANPSAGNPDRPSPLPAVKRRLPFAAVHELEGSENLASVVRNTRGIRALGVLGGDGTVSSAAHIARAQGLPLLVVPGGTLNHFARTAGIAEADASIDALQSGTGRRVDVAELSVDGDAPVTVLNTASVGIYPYFVAKREQRERAIGKRLASLFAAIEAVTRANPLEVVIDGKSARVWSVFVGVNKYYRESAAPLQRRRLDDGVLDVRVLHAGPNARTNAVLELAFGDRAVRMLRRLRVWREASRVERFTATEVSLAVRGHAGPGIAHDGEASAPGASAGDGFKARIRIVPGGLDLYAPWPASRASASVLSVP